MDYDFEKAINSGGIIFTEDKTSRLIGLGLISGGLDSLIACLVIKLQNIENKLNGLTSALKKPHRMISPPSPKSPPVKTSVMILRVVSVRMIHLNLSVCIYQAAPGLIGGSTLGTIPPFRISRTFIHILMSENGM